MKSLHLNGCNIENNFSAEHYWNNLANLEQLEIINCVNASKIFENFRHFTNLRSLTIRDSISGEVDISCDALKSLENLDLSDNLITKFTPPSSCPDLSPLTTLNLHGNELSSLDWSGLEIFSSLVTVNLSSNPSLATMRPPRSPLASVSVLDLSGAAGLETLCDSLLRALPHLSRLGLGGDGLTSLPPSLSHLNDLTDLLENVRPHCSCELLALIRSDPDLEFTCMLGDQKEFLVSSEAELLERLECSPAEIRDGEEEMWVETPGLELLISCQVEGSPAPSVLWLTPRHELLSVRPEADHCQVQQQELLSDSSRDYTSWEGHFHILHNGSLLIDQFGWRDRGDYLCYVDNILANSSLTTKVRLNHNYRHVIYLWSLLYGLVTAVSFLGKTFFK